MRENVSTQMKSLWNRRKDFSENRGLKIIIIIIITRKEYPGAAARKFSGCLFFFFNALSSGRGQMGGVSVKVKTFDPYRRRKGAIKET